MDTVQTQPNTGLHGEEDENHEKKPVLKKVMDKVKKIKKSIGKRSPRHGNEGADDDPHQHDDDEGDEEFEENEEINDDRAVHGVPRAGAGGEGIRGFGDSEADMGIEQNRDRSTRKGVEGVRGGEGLITEKFVGDLIPPGTEAETNTGIELSQGYVSPATSLRTKEHEITGAGGQGVGRVGDGLGVIKEEFVDYPAAPKHEVHGANEKWTGGEGAERNKVGLGLINEEFIKDSTAPMAEAERNTKNEQSRAYDSSATGARTEAKDLYGGRESAKRVDDDGLGLNTKDFVNGRAAARTGDETNSGIEGSRVHLSPTSAARTGVNDIAGGGEAEVSEGVGDASGLTTMELVEDPAAPRTESGTNTKTEQSQGGEEVEMSPELYHSLDAMVDSSYNDRGETEHPKGQNSSYTGMVSSAASKAYGTVADAGKAVISKVIPRKENGDDEAAKKQGGEELDKSPELSRSMEAMTLSTKNDRAETELPKDQNRSYSGMVSSAASKVYEVVADAGTAVISKVKPDARKDGEDELVGKQGGEELDKSPELSRSMEAMTLSTQNDREEAELPKDQNRSYTGIVSSAASKVYDVVADAGSAVISKVKPDARKVGEDEVVGKQGKGISIKEYITEKLTPGEDEKALSELIREAGQKRENEAVETQLPEKTRSDDGGKGVGVVERIRGTVTSFLGGGESSPKSPAKEAQRKVGEDDELNRATAEAFSHEKRSSEELPPSYH